MTAWQRLGEQIRGLRQRRGLTQADLAREASLSLIYIKKLETGDRQSPSFPALARIARALDARLHVELVGRTARQKGGQHGRQD
jgi:transcriptional regulator with XRE-family HTH domain